MNDIVDNEARKARLVGKPVRWHMVQEDARRQS